MSLLRSVKPPKERVMDRTDHRTLEAVVCGKRCFFYAAGGNGDVYSPFI